MSKPLIVLLSEDSRLICELPARLKCRFTFAVCESSEEVGEFFADNSAAAFVADFCTISNGGHSQDRLLGDLQCRFPEMPLLMLTGDHCPEPLRRRAACSDLAHLHGEADLQNLMALLIDRIPTQDMPVTSFADGTTGSAGDDAVRAETVLHGMTRRFETKTPQLKTMLVELEVAARHDVTILLIGETGSGKTFLSRLIHEVSPRKHQPFLTVSCGALPAELIESELFGHVKGAFTSAHANKDGKFVAAGRGTILLDEIDVLGTEQQVKLLRVIETGEFEPVGSNKTLKSQARLVVASNLDLQPLVEQGRFRPDLYYRLNMLKFEIPPLRQRKPDIPPLARKFIGQLAARHGIKIRHCDVGVFEALQMYVWPGNVRELENVIQRAVIYSRDEKLSLEQFPAHILGGPFRPLRDPSVTRQKRNHVDSTLGQQLACNERKIIQQTLFENNFSRTNTAKDLGISRVTLYNKMKKYGMTK